MRSSELTGGARLWTLLRAVALLLALASSPGFAAPWDTSTDALPAVPPLSGRVVDLAQALSASERTALEAKLADWESRTGNQLVVAMVPTTRPESIEEYSLRLAEAWKIGQKGTDNGALFVIAKDDKRMRIEVGYGLEGVLTDVTSRRIIGDVVAPLFKQGQFAAGINAGVDKIISVVADGKPLPAAQPQRGRAAPSHGVDLGTLFILLLVVVPVLGGIMRSMFGNIGGSTIGAGIVGAAAWFLAGSLVIAGIAGVIAFLAMLLSLFGGRGGRGGWLPMGMGGGGFSGGGGGGFSGGGGSFGGGGASGGWD